MRQYPSLVLAAYNASVPIPSSKRFNSRTGHPVFSSALDQKERETQRPTDLPIPQPISRPIPRPRLGVTNTSFGVDH